MDWLCTQEMVSFHFLFASWCLVTGAQLFLPSFPLSFLFWFSFFFFGFTTTSPCTPRLLHQGTLGLPTVHQTPTHPEQRKQSVEAVWTRNAETLEAND